MELVDPRKQEDQPVQRGAEHEQQRCRSQDGEESGGRPGPARAQSRQYQEQRKDAHVGARLYVVLPGGKSLAPGDLGDRLAQGVDADGGYPQGGEVQVGVDAGIAEQIRHDEGRELTPRVGPAHHILVGDSVARGPGAEVSLHQLVERDELDAGERHP